LNLVTAQVVECVDGNYSTICMETLFYVTARITHLSPFLVTAGGAVFAAIPVCRERGSAFFLVNCITFNSWFLLLLFYFCSRTHLTSKKHVASCILIFY
jgi:hypothetical protein